MHSASLLAAMCPTGQTIRMRPPFIRGEEQAKARFIPRCYDCIRDRYCSGCHRWWCESCYVGLGASPASDTVSSPLSQHHCNRA
jgi:hypothetical protein